MPGPDFPDWSQQTVAGIRFAGGTPVSSGGVQRNLDIAVTTFERAVLIHTPNDPSGVWTIQVIGLSTGRVSTYVTGIGADQWIVAYVNPAFDPTWEVQVTNAGATNLYCECFVDTTLPLVRVANVAGQAVPVTFDPASLSGGLAPSIVSGSVGVTVAGADATVVAAPGVGHHLRVFAATLSVNRQVTGITDLTLLAGVGGTIIMRALALSAGGQANVSYQWPGGYDLPDATLLDCRMDGTVAGGFGVWLVYYSVV